MSLANDLRDRSLRLKLGLSRWEQGLVRDVISLLNEGEADLERRIGLAVERSASEDTIRRLRRIRDELRTVNAEAYQAVGKRLTSELQEASVRTVGRYAEVLEAGIPLDFSFTRPSAPLLRAIVTSKSLQGALLKDHIAKLAGNRLDALTRQLDLGLLQGESLSQLLQRVRGTRRARFRDGVLERVGRHQAATLTRTAAMHVTETARDQLFQQNADIVSGTMWVATLDHHTCRICQPRDGLVWKFNPDTGTYEPDGHSTPWDGGPGRAHFRCRCTGIPVLNDLSELEAAGIDTSKLTSGERAAWENPVPVTVGYEEWLRDQSLEIQRAALGAEGRVKLFRSGKSLEEAWAKKFFVQFTAPAVLDEVLPAGITVEAETVPEVLRPPPTQPPRFKKAEEATQWLRDNYAQIVSLDGATVAQLQEIADGIHAALYGNRAAKLRAIEWKTSRKRRASLGLFSPSNQTISLQKSFVRAPDKVAQRTAQNWQVQNQRAIQGTERLLARLRDPKAPIGGDRRAGIKKADRRLQALKANARWAAFQDADRPLFAVAAHEAGHAVMWQRPYPGLGGPIAGFFERELKGTTSFRTEVSEYAASAFYELWAEISALVASGRSHQVPQDLLDAWVKTMEFVRKGIADGSL